MSSVMIDRVIAKLKGKSLKGKKRLTMRVEYTAPYAIYVHENLSARHPNGGQAKFLEQPSRILRKRMAAIVKRSVTAKNGLEEGLMRSGNLLLTESRKLVPVDTGFLRDSGKVVIEGSS